MSRTVSASTCRVLGANTKPERVGIERGREQRVVLVGDAADLDEHQPARRPTAGAVSSPSNAPGSAARTSASPTRTASKPAAAIRAGVGPAPHRALRDRDHIGRKARRQRLRDTEILGERREVAAVDADDARAGQRARARPRARRALRRARRARGRRPSACRSASSASSGIAATMSRIASAPIARASYTWTSSMVKSLRRTGSSTVSRATCRSATEPPKYGSSVSTDSAAAPPCSYALAVAAGSRSGASSPFDGERRFISPITARCSSARRSAAPNARVGGASSAWRRSRSRVCGCRSTVTSSRFVARISSRTLTRRECTAGLIRQSRFTASRRARRPRRRRPAPGPRSAARSLSGPSRARRIPPRS